VLEAIAILERRSGRRRRAFEPRRRAIRCAPRADASRIAPISASCPSTPIERGLAAEAEWALAALLRRDARVTRPRSLGRDPRLNEVESLPSSTRAGARARRPRPSWEISTSTTARATAPTS
jgi:hypothetical protein